MIRSTMHKKIQRANNRLRMNTEAAVRFIADGMRI